MRLVAFGNIFYLILKIEYFKEFVNESIYSKKNIFKRKLNLKIKVILFLFFNIYFYCKDQIILKIFGAFN